MTNDEIRAVVITGKYAVRASPREKRNTQLEEYNYGDDNDYPQDPTELHDTGAQFREDLALIMWWDYRHGKYRHA